MPKANHSDAELSRKVMAKLAQLGITQRDLVAETVTTRGGVSNVLIGRQASHGTRQKITDCANCELWPGMTPRVPAGLTPEENGLLQSAFATMRPVSREWRTLSDPDARLRLSEPYLKLLTPELLKVILKVGQLTAGLLILGRTYYLLGPLLFTLIPPAEAANTGNDEAGRARIRIGDAKAGTAKGRKGKA